MDRRERQLHSRLQPVQSRRAEQLAAGGDSCGAISDRNFGTATLSRNFDPAALKGWGVRPADWEFGVSVQEVLPRVSVELGYFRRWLDNFFVDDNLATVPADFTPFSITAPSTAPARRRWLHHQRPL